MKKGQIFEGIIERVVFPNKGIIKTEEKEVITNNVIIYNLNKASRCKLMQRLKTLFENKWSLLWSKVI